MRKGKKARKVNILMKPVLLKDCTIVRESKKSIGISQKKGVKNYVHYLINKKDIQMILDVGEMNKDRK